MVNSLAINVYSKTTVNFLWLKHIAPVLQQFMKIVEGTDVHF